MKRKDLLRKLKEAGFHEVRDDGDHTIYKKANCFLNGNGWLMEINMKIYTQ